MRGTWIGGVLGWVAGAAMAQAPQPTTLRHLAEALSLQFVQLEANACTAAHPQQAADWEPGVARFEREVRHALDAHAAREPELLSRPVPGVMFGHLEQMRALHALEGPARDLARCQRFGQEHANALAAEISTVMAQTVTSLARSVAEFRQGMDGLKP